MTTQSKTAFAFSHRTHLHYVSLHDRALHCTALEYSTLGFETLPDINPLLSRIQISTKIYLFAYQRHPTDRFRKSYLFGRRIIPSDFLKRIVTSNSCDMRNLISVIFGMLKMSFWVQKKKSAIIFRKAIRLTVFGKWTKKP